MTFYFFVVHTLSPKESCQVQELLLNGYWAFECLTVRDYNDMICGICGITPKLEIAQRYTNNALELKNVEVMKLMGHIWKEEKREQSISQLGLIIPFDFCTVHLARRFCLGWGACGWLLADHGKWSYRAGSFPFRHPYHTIGCFYHCSLYTPFNEESHCHQHRER